MAKTLKFIGYLFLLGLAIISLYIINLFAMKPYSMDHYLAKELTMSLLDSPEFMTYVGIFDKYNAFLKHNQKLSIRTLEDGDNDYQDSLDHLSMLQSYDPSKLSDIQKVTQKIAIFDTENNIDQDYSVLLIIWYWYILIIFFRNYIVLGGEITQFQDDKE